MAAMDLLVSDIQYNVVKSFAVNESLVNVHTTNNIYRRCKPEAADLNQEAVTLSDE